LDFGVGELVAHFYGPLASTRSDIEDTLRIVEGCEVIVVHEAVLEDLELEIETVSLGRVIGEVVG